MPSQVDTIKQFITRGDFTTVTAASVAAGTDFCNVNFDLSNAAPMAIDNLEMSVFTDAADFANLQIGTLRIFRNITVDPDQSLANQLGQTGITTFWEARTQRVQDLNLNRQFSTPIILDSGYRYSIVGFFNFSAAIGTSVLFDLFVLGRSLYPVSDQYFGVTR